MTIEPTMGKPNQQVFSDTLLEIAKQNENILVVTSDSRGSGKLVAFGQELPQQIVVFLCHKNSFPTPQAPSGTT